PGGKGYGPAGAGAASPGGTAGAGGTRGTAGGAAGDVGTRGTHDMALRPSSVPQCVVLLEPPTSSLPHVPDPESNLARTASPTVTRLLASVNTDLDLESTAAFTLVT
ncbi:unnamed protein product, partial [Closterium sp. NIES-53]